MYLVVGLGNPGLEYEHTRHNVGFDVIDIIANRYNIDINRKKFKGVYGEGVINGEKVILLKPDTYMNLSGESLIQVVDFYKIPNDNIIVVYDDISLKIGQLRIKSKGSAGGHNGVKNIILHLGSDEFPRVKVGIGHPEQNLVSHVLGKFGEEQWKKMQDMFSISADAVECIMKENIASAMNKFNGVNL